jgi:hypothetical protein
MDMIEVIISLKDEVLSSRMKINMQLHRIQLFTICNAQYLWCLKKRGIIDELRTFPNDGRRNRIYKKIALWTFNDVKLKSYFEPIKQDMNPLCMTTSLSIKSGTPKAFLESLYKLLGKQYVVSAEYKVDLFFDTPELVRKAFYLIRRSLYIPYGRNTKMVGSNRHICGWNDRCGNFVYFVGNTKVYERGIDKRKAGWKFEELDRVRIEYTARYNHLNKHGIKPLSDFIKNPMFVDTIVPRLRFAKFKTCSKLPCEFDDYLAKDKDGNRDCFQEEYRQSPVKNPSQYMVDDPDFDVLKARIIEAAERTQRNWLCGEN